MCLMTSLETFNMFQPEDPEDEEIDPLNDIIDYLVRSANVSFKTTNVNQPEIKTICKVKMAYEILKKSPTDFLMQYGKYLAPYHLDYFEKLQAKDDEKHAYIQCVNWLKKYHSEESKNKRVRNRRYKALQKLRDETDYFSEKQMMFRNPLLYEQLIGQYLTDEEIKQRDSIDFENMTVLNMVLETVDRNTMTELKEAQKMAEETDLPLEDNQNGDLKRNVSQNTKHWGGFQDSETFVKKRQKQALISAPEKYLLREEFFQEMYSSFIEGKDVDVDYQKIDTDEQYDDLEQISQDAEDRYFDSEQNDIENLEQHMKLSQEYGKTKSISKNDEDPLDEFMKHISIKLNTS